MKIQEGKYYKRVDGTVIGPAKRRTSFGLYPFYFGDDPEDACNWYYDDGSCDDDEQPGLDLSCEVPEPIEVFLLEKAVEEDSIPKLRALLSYNRAQRRELLNDCNDLRNQVAALEESSEEAHRRFNVNPDYFTRRAQEAEKERDELRVGRQELLAEVTLLNKQLAEADQYLKFELDANSDLRIQLAEVKQELECESATLKVTQKLWAKTQHELAEDRASYKDLWKDREEIRIQLAEAREELHEWQRNGGPGAPTILKQTWQNVYSRDAIVGIPEVGDIGFSRSAVDAVAGKYRIGVLRRVHMSDGTVQAILEPIGDDNA